MDGNPPTHHYHNHPLEGFESYVALFLSKKRNVQNKLVT
jgi:hypothetical protein